MEIKEVALFDKNGKTIGYSIQEWAEKDQEGILILQKETRTYFGLEDYFVTCPVEDVEFDEYKRPYYKFNGKVYLSRKKEYPYQVSN